MIKRRELSSQSIGVLVGCRRGDTKADRLSSRSEGGDTERWVIAWEPSIID